MRPLQVEFLTAAQAGLVDRVAAGVEQAGMTNTAIYLKEGIFDDPQTYMRTIKVDDRHLRFELRPFVELLLHEIVTILEFDGDGAAKDRAALDIIKFAGF